MPGMPQTESAQTGPEQPGSERQGEEFRLGTHGTASGDGPPAAVLPIAVVRQLSRVQDWRAAWSVAWSFGLIALTAIAASLWWHPVTVVLAIVVMAGLQHGLFVLAHTAAHYRLFQRRRLNDLVGRTCGVLIGVSMCSYRVLHRLHHNHLYEKIDPDIPLIAGYPRGRAYLLRKLGRDLAGLTAWKTYAYFFGLPMQNTASDGPNRPLDDTSPRLRAAALRDRWMVLGFHAAAPVAAFATGWGVEYLLLWALPLVTVLQALLRLRAVLEHGAVQEHGAAPDTASPLTAARTNLAPWWLRWWLFPHQVNYHIEHHLYPAVPHYNGPALHHALRDAGALEGANVLPVGQAIKVIFGEPQAKAT